MKIDAKDLFLPPATVSEHQTEQTFVANDDDCDLLLPPSLMDLITHGHEQAEQTTTERENKGMGEVPPRQKDRIQQYVEDEEEEAEMRNSYGDWL